MKRFSALLMITVLIFLTACSGQPGGTKNNKNGGNAGSGVKTVVVAVETSSRLLEQAVEKFEQQNENIKIEIKEYMALPNEAGGEGKAAKAITQADIQKYVQSVTTEVLSGRGSDIISTSSLPIDQFIKKQMFVDLNQLMKQDASFDKNLYYGNILDSMEQGGGLYHIALDFMLEGIFSANEDLLKKAGVSFDDSTWTWNQFMEISKQMRQNLGKGYSTALYYDPAQLFSELVMANYSELVKDGKPHFDSKLFKDIMQQVKVLSDKGTLVDMNSGSSSVMGRGQSSDKPENQVFMPYSMISSLKGAFMALTQPLQSRYLSKPTVNGDSPGVVAQISNGFAINSKSMVQPEAWKFLKFLLSEEVQQSSEIIGYPVNKMAAAKVLETERAKFEKENEGAATAEKLDEHVKMIQGMLEKATVSPSGDIRLVMLIMEYFESFLKGQKSLEEVTTLIQNRAATFLNE